MLVFAPNYEEPDPERAVHIDEMEQHLAGPQIRAHHTLVVKDAYALVRAQTHFGRLADVKLVLLAASPLLGDAADLAALVNLLRRNDGLPALSPDDPGFPAALCARASFSLPRTFSAARRLVDYPHHRIDAPHLRHRIEFLDVHPVRCSAHQIQAYRAAGTETEKLSALTMSYPKHQSFEACVARSGERFSYTGERCFANLSKYSPKLAAVVRAVEQGPAVIYARFSAIAAALALEEAGFRRFGAPLLDLPGGNGRRYALLTPDISNTAEELALADVKIVVAPGSFKAEQVHVLDPTPLGQVEDLLGQCTPAQVFLYASLIDLDEEALDLFFYRQQETAAEQVVRLFQPTRAECFKEKLVFTRAELLRRFSREDLAALVQGYVVNRFGACGTVARVDDYYFFEPCAPDPLEEEYLQACGLLHPPHRTWGRLAAAVLQDIPSDQRDCVVVAHVVESRGLVEREKLLRRVLEERRTRFDHLALAYFDRHCKVGDGYVLLRAAAVDPVGPVGTMGANGFTLLARHGGKWVATNNTVLHLLPLLNSLSESRGHGDREMVCCELELRLRLLDGERRWFLTPAEAASL